MKRAALGIQMHSGWGVLVAVCADDGLIEILDRRRILTVDPEIAATKQPYHHAATLPLPEAEKHIANCEAATTQLALRAMGEVLRELGERQCRIAGCAVLLASGRPLPPLEKILAAHPLIHTAEGEFFRHTIRSACETLRIPVTAMPERELEDRARRAFGNAASRVQQNIASLGASIGPPWTRDHKHAALAAALILASTNKAKAPAQGAKRKSAHTSRES
jgi:hypothetical protein